MLILTSFRKLERMYDGGEAIEPIVTMLKVGQFFYDTNVICMMYVICRLDFCQFFNLEKVCMC